MKLKIKGLTKGNRAVKLLCLFMALALVFGVAAVFAQKNAERLFGWTSTVHRERREIEPNPYISISSADIPLEVYTYNGDAVIIEYVGETALIAEWDELELRIARVEDFTLSLFSLDTFNYKMTVRLPAYYDYYKEIKLSSASGDIYAENIVSEYLGVTSRAGDITLFAISGEIEAETRFGIVDIERDSDFVE